MLIVDPWKLKVSDLTGNERVGVINWTTKEKVKINLKFQNIYFVVQLSISHSPTLKKLESWLSTHPQYLVDSVWSPLAIEWVINILY